MLIYNCSQGERKRLSLLRVLEKRKRDSKSLDSNSIKSYSYYIKEKGFEKRKRDLKKS